MAFDFPVFGEHDAATLQQLETCIAAENGAKGVLMADGHLGYSMPIGGVVGYHEHISVSGVGYDIGCGNLAVKTNIKYADFAKDAPRVADEIQRRISFGVGRTNAEPVSSEYEGMFDYIADSPVHEQRQWLNLARQQFGTVGSGNHYVDILEDESGFVWIACHFGSRGFGHHTASMFMNLAQGLPALGKSHDGEMMAPPLLIRTDTPMGTDYLAAMELAGMYAYQGRTYVVRKVLEILGTDWIDLIHNHHNFAWAEEHSGEKLWVVRKGATPAFPGQRGFIGGSMGDICVIVMGVGNVLAEKAMFSTVHGAGRVMSRSAAVKGKSEWRCPAPDQDSCDGTYFNRQPPKNLTCPVHGFKLEKVQIQAPIDFQRVQQQMAERGVILRGAGADESPQVYRDLSNVLASHAGTIYVETIMKPRIVVMAGKGTVDPYKD